MSTDELFKLQFPIGEFDASENIIKAHVNAWITDIETFSMRLKKVIENLNNKEFNYKYRPESWTIKQVVHHCADNHLNSLSRFKLALTEVTPTIRPYI